MYLRLGRESWRIQEFGVHCMSLSPQSVVELRRASLRI